ncbi:CoA transferase [Comamonas thiooxydans]|uniref:CoA transferase n=1 Tax=Comamonas thiooxydans TaxID=363952 RepID=A0AA42Q301_9BURK|nr:CaiB/BaiF CoA-transferase family protein [Comamonas thiooxydans]MDH1336322.1 CoA transferase [Comamonas thiooxydans]MDH1742181.1 CoA transferase [Comamonas thiooxydans]MDH1788783.1 CoA transferase [Comamonas thiooxydans]
MPSTAIQPLQGIRILSLALNLPGPAALWRCAGMGADCRKLEPLAPGAGRSADPMGLYCPDAYAQMHDKVQTLQADLKTAEGQASLHEQLAQTDVLLTSFRPSALSKLGLGWEALQQRYPRLSLVRVVGSAGELADVPGHDLTYQAEAGLVHSTALPPSLFADMAGALMASEAVLQAVLVSSRSGRGILREVGLAQAAQWLALPWHWGLTQPTGDVGGAHAGYRIYPCADGIVAVAALEPHFAQRLCEAADLPFGHPTDMRKPEIHQGVARFLAARSCTQLMQLAQEKDIPLHALPQT